MDAGVPLRTFVQHGMPCTARMLALASVPWLVLVVAQWRGAPLHAMRAGALAGAAAFVAALVWTRFLCTHDEPLHVVAWHQLPVPLGTGVSAIAGAVCLGRWRRPGRRDL
jgi:hypothetical protein